MNTASLSGRISRKLALLARKSLYGLAGLVRNPFAARRLLLLRPDGIGDYVLFRNFLEPLRQGNRFSAYRFTLLGNPAFRSLAEQVDADVFEEMIWVDPALLYDQSYGIQSLKLLLKLRLKGFDTVVYPVHSRLPGIDKFIARIGSKHTIASMGDAINAGAEKAAVDALYDELVPVPDTTHFEFFRNRSFAEALAQQSLEHIALTLPFANEARNSKHIVLFPGAGHAFRRWPIAHFAKLVQLLQQHDAALQFYVCGSGNDSPLAQELMSLTPGCNVLNNTGDGTLHAFASFVGSAALLVSNETSAVHIGAAVHTPTLCLSNGNHYGRFNPYPAAMHKPVVTLYSDPAFHDPALAEANSLRTQLSSAHDIALLQPQAVFEAAIGLLDS